MKERTLFYTQACLIALVGAVHIIALNYYLLLVLPLARSLRAFSRGCLGRAFRGVVLRRDGACRSFLEDIERRCDRRHRMGTF